MKGNRNSDECQGRLGTISLKSDYYKKTVLPQLQTAISRATSENMASDRKKTSKFLSYEIREMIRIIFSTTNNISHNDGGNSQLYFKQNCYVLLSKGMAILARTTSTTPVCRVCNNNAGILVRVPTSYCIGETGETAASQLLKFSVHKMRRPTQSIPSYNSL